MARRFAPPGRARPSTPAMLLRFQSRLILAAGQPGGGADFGQEGECICACDVRRDGRCPGPPLDSQPPCYVPVCQAGTYRCCATCSMSTCANKMELVKSKRDIFECIVCQPGDYCPGCDIREPCPEGTIGEEQRLQMDSDCIECDYSQTRSWDRTRCCDTEACAERGAKPPCEGEGCEEDAAAAVSLLLAMLAAVH